MALPNPSLDPPRLTAAHSSTATATATASSSRTTSYTRPTRSPAHSPSRPKHQHHDSFIRDLSPTKTLRAFAAESRGRPNDVLLRSIADAAPAQRVLGRKVAEACADLRSWTREMEGWGWPGGFDVPETVRKRQQRGSAMTLLSLTASSIAESENGNGGGSGKEGEVDAGGEEMGEYWGSLPAATVKAHEQRLDAICLAFDNIDFDELKDFVLSAHDQAGGSLSESTLNPSTSIGTIGAATDLKRLDDFTALITATILHALPYLPRLTTLLDTWATRLAILRAAPAYIRDLRRARTDLDHGWAALAVSPAHTHTAQNAQFSSENLAEMQGLISSQVYSLGKRLDRFLDTLEGRQEVVPDAWIDDFEELEAEYGEWVVKAERKVLEGEWRTMKEQVKETVLKLAREDEARQGAVPEDEGGYGDVEDEVEARDVRLPQRNGSSRSIGGTAPPVPAVIRSTAASSGIKPLAGSTITTVISGPLTNNATQTSSKASSVTSSAGGRAREIPTLGRTSRERTPSASPTRRAANTSQVEASPPKSRHVPIVVNYSDPSQSFDIPRDGSLDSSMPKTSTSQSIADLAPITTITTNTTTTTTADGKEMPPTLVRTKSKTPSESASSTVKQRAAFLNGDIERSESLVKIKSAPVVRPFEHASNAFTRLFKRENPAMGIDEVRSRYNESRNSQRNLSVDEGAGAGGKSASVSSSQNSGSAASGSGKTTGSSGESKKKNSKEAQRLEYMDMARAPSPVSKKSLDKLGSSRGRDPAKASRMVYGDLPLAMGAAVDPERLKTPRKSGESKREKARTLEKEGKGDVPLPSAAAATPRAGPSDRRHSFDETKRSKSSPPTHRTKDVAPLGALPPRPNSRDNTSSRPKQQISERSITKPSPATYRPTGFSEPVIHASQTRTAPETFPDTLDDDFPADWPLSSSAATPVETPPGTADREYFGPLSAASLTRALDGSTLPSNDFEEFFVRTLPSRTRVEEKDFGQEVRRPSSAPGFRTPVEMRGGGLVRPVSVVKEEDGEEMFDVDLGEREAEGEGYDDEWEGEADSAAAYFGRHFGEGTPRASSIALDTVGSFEEGEGEEDEDEEFKRASVASIASIESHTRAEVRSIDIPRRSLEERPLDGPTPEPQTPRAADENGAEAEGSDTSPLMYKRTMVFPSPPPSVPTRGSSLRSSMSSAKSSDSPSAAVKQRLSASSPLAEDEETKAVSPPPLNTAITKQRAGNKPRSRGSLGETPASPTTTTTTTTTTTMSSTSRRKKSDPPLKPGEDTFDRHVSEVLDRVRAPIRFKTRPGSTTPVARATPTTGPRGKTKTNMTLAPAETSPGKRPASSSAAVSSSAAADPEVKLYHLTQVGKAEPIKLYVRLVGEGERVMVRVGGGWADLADYLRQYAEHHGSRTVSEGALELQTAGVGGSGSAPGSAGPGSATTSASKRGFSGPAGLMAVEPKSRMSPITPTPSSASAGGAGAGRDSWGLSRIGNPPIGNAFASNHVSTVAAGDTTTTTTTSTTVSKPDPWGLSRNSARQPRLWIGSYSDDEDVDAEQQSPTLGRQTQHPTPWDDTRPRSATGGSRPSTADGAAGLAGVRGKTELPEQKARWVEGMIEKAMKSASASAAGARAVSPVEREKAFGDMGRVGGTRRVVFRSEGGK